MSLLIASEISTESGTQPLTLSVGQQAAGPRVVLNTANTQVTIVGGIGATGNLNDSKGNLRDLPINTQTTAYTLVLQDFGRVVSTTQNVTIPADVFSSGDPVTIFNNTVNSRTITPAAGVTLYLAGTSLTGVRTLAQRGIATLLCISANVFVITGVGLS